MSATSIKVGLVGVGNCASAFVQGLSFYGDASPKDQLIGLMSPEIGGFRPGDITVVSAFDVDARKVGLDVSEAVFAGANNTAKFGNPTSSEVRVMRGPTLDGLGRYLSDKIPESLDTVVDVVHILKSTGTEVLINYLPVGSQIASEFYAQCALEARCAFINCIPVFIASDTGWAKRFISSGLPIIGDDVKSQLGATILHRTLAQLFNERGVTINRTYQLNFGGNTDFLNMLERDRLESKKISKTRAVRSQIASPVRDDCIHVGPSDFVPWLEDRKWAYIRIEATGFGKQPINLEVKLEVWDSPNSAGVVIDAVRCAKLALDRGAGGPLLGPSGWLMKSPPVQLSDAEAREMTLAFIETTTSQARSPERVH